MITGINSLQTHHLPSTMSRTQIQSTPAVTIPVRAVGPQACYPTHVLALSAPKSAGDATLLLTHALVLAANCSGLPRLPATAPATPQGTSVTLPVLPLTVPSPAAFAPLHSFLYTHSTRSLLAALLPSVPSAFVSTLSTPGAIRGTLASGPALHTLSDHLVRHVRPAQLPAVAQGIAAVWRNAVALGVHDPEFWDTLDLSWEVVLGALNLAAGAQ
ncbi:hypothetical protein CONPUDRAFT_82948 [Coniophora puteana RWD-64-598 SS2]|uniref:Clp1-like protein n=1 Tax=Coniophora puteana (strain RWD-64-598) TaxID=741705 RepID=A0A5M3ML64_CONPW|nr:uncharacterized protein CONPUDRAFT_82948 [Coniophora puteana RWD-64-598 SS2]EIW79554.1 hypothetical protein CONPUDRAFT_82948 [Coniophora puteana RWD-64-598 SS2]